MRIALINGSPKAKDSASGCILRGFAGMLEEGTGLGRFHLRNDRIEEEVFSGIAECDALVFAFPLYVDGIPSHLLRWLTVLEGRLAADGKKRQVFAIANCGFYEGRQADLALEMMEHWCARAGQAWGLGLGVGGGGMLVGLDNIPMGKGPKANLGRALQGMAGLIGQAAPAGNLYINPNFPRFLYKAAAEMGWRHMARKNGLGLGDLSGEPLPRTPLPKG